MKSTLWIYKDRTGTYLSEYKPIFDKNNDIFERSLRGSSAEVIEISRGLVKGLKIRTCKKVSSILLQENSK